MKVFRLHTNGADTYSGWNSSTQFPYDNTSRQTIIDPDGATASKEITSIPSPFARIDLVKNAFKEVVNSGNLDGNTIYHKMISDSLDVGEIFFNIDQYSDVVRILKWNKNDCINQLISSRLDGHKIFADAFDKYWQSDSEAYNFADTQNFYLLEYFGPQRTQDCIIGATSPATLFFSTANDLSFISNNLQQGQVAFFDNNYEALYRRNFEYVKMLWTIKCTILSFANKLTDVDRYLDLTYNKLSDIQKTELDRITNNPNIASSDFSRISVENNDIEILGVPIYKRRTTQINDSEFTINSQIQTIYNPLPLVLPVNAGNKYANLKYTVDNFGNTNRAPFYDRQEDITLRQLPNDNRQQPYLTISDFLQPYIIKVLHKINNTSYFNGNYNNDAYSFLLPLTKRFFEFFTISDLQGKVDGQPMIEIQDVPGGIRVVLRIPIRGNENIRYIEYTRNYIASVGNKPQINLSDNIGCIVECEFDAFIMPAIEFINSQDAFYRVYLANSVEVGIGLSFYNGNEEITTNRYLRGNNGSTQMETYTIEGNKFDCIKITLNNFNDIVEGFVVPIFRQQQNLNTTKIAIDFGTSNTCIAYKMTNGSGRILEYNDEESPLCPLFINNDDREEFGVVERNILPNKLNRNSECFLPTRSVISYSIHNLIDFSQPMPAFAITNIDFFYNKRRNYDYNRNRTNLKWGTDRDTGTLVKYYIECILLLIRNKILLSNGGLSNTEIVWFYPVSMSPNRLNLFRNVWQMSIQKYFGNITTNEITESVAPIQYIIQNNGGAQNIVNIDIGGGTTDIAYSHIRNVKWSASIRFASDDLFRENNGQNGILEYFKPKLIDVLRRHNLTDLISIFDSIGDRENKATEEALFLFSLKSHKKVRENNLQSEYIDFDNLLQNNEDFKIVFILFYSAIIYYIAHILKLQDLTMPDHINFSGNGSKNISVVSNNPDTLAEYSKRIFQLVGIGSKNLTISGLQNRDISPKEVTCLGGLSIEENISNGNIIVLKSENSFVVENDTLAIFNNEQYIDDLVDNVISFFKLVLENLPTNYLNNNFGVSASSLSIAQRMCYDRQQIRQYLNRAIDDLTRANNMTAVDQIPIKEPLFFYPIKGLLIELSNAIYQSLNNEII